MEDQWELVCDISNNLESSNNWKMVQDRARVTTADQYKFVYDLSIGTIFNYLERHLTQISRSRQYSTLNISGTVEDRDIVTMEDEKTNRNSYAVYRMVPFPVTLNDLQPCTLQGHAIVRRLISLMSLIPFFVLLLKTKRPSMLTERNVRLSHLLIGSCK